MTFKMKNNNILLVAIATLMCLSCRKELNQTPLSAATTSTFYTTPSDFIQAVNATYNALRSYPTRQLFLSEVRSDNIYGVTVAGRDWDAINNFSKGVAPNVYVEDAWNSDFIGIFRANTVLDQISRNGSNVGSATLATRLQAEARFLRAFFYFDLIRYFGKVPIIDHPVSLDEANKIPRSKIEDVYQLIISDLKFAIANLPSNYSGTFPAYSATDAGRATKFAAEAYLAQVYMTRSSPTYGIEGPGLASGEWNLALPLLQDIISAGGFTFNPVFSSIFSYTNQNPSVNREAIFDILYIAGQNPSLGADFVWQLAPSGYFGSLGTNTISNGSLEIIPVSNNLLNSFETSDIRKSFSIYTSGYTFNGSTESRPFFKKYLDITKIPTTSRTEWAMNFIAVRFTDILMLKAECILNGASGSQADVDGIVNQVRSRAGLTNKTGITISQLFDERRKEFAGEGLRWFDLQRTGNLVNIMNNWATADDVSVPRRIATVTANSVIYPVPQSQIDAAPGLYTQNPGY